MGLTVAQSMLGLPVDIMQYVVMELRTHAEAGNMTVYGEELVSDASDIFHIRCAGNMFIDGDEQNIAETLIGIFRRPGTLLMKTLQAKGWYDESGKVIDGKALATYVHQNVMTCGWFEYHFVVGERTKVEAIVPLVESAKGFDAVVQGQQSYCRRFENIPRISR
jgi:hypothetical protein